MNNDELARQRRMKVVEIAKRYAVNIQGATEPIHEDRGKDNYGESLRPLKICEKWHFGLPWCAAFITLVVKKTCESLPGSISQYWLDSAASNGVKPEGKICTITDNETAKQIKSGMILCRGASGNGHVVLAVKDYNPSTRKLEIIAGNTSVEIGNVAIDRNGGNCVYKAYPLESLISQGYKLYKIWEETDIKPVEQTDIVSGTSSNSSGNNSGNNDYAGSTESQQAQIDYSVLFYGGNDVSKTSDTGKTEANEKNTSPTTNDGKSDSKSENSQKVDKTTYGGTVSTT